MVKHLKFCNNTGVLNEQNICFLNSVVQLLHSLPDCREYFLNKKYKTTNERQLFPICDEISIIFRFSGGLSSVGSLRQKLGNAPGCSYFNDGTQQDAGALLLALLDLVNTEIQSVSGRESSLMEKLTSKQRIAYNFLGTEDGSCPSCEVLLKVHPF